MPYGKAPRKQLDSRPAGAKPRKSHPSAIARREIHSKGDNLVIDKQSFQRLVKEISVDVLSRGIRFDSHAIMAMQDGTEMYTSSLIGDAQLCAKFANRATVFPCDIWLALRLNGQ